ncbi:MAG: hypothetical protein ACJAU2_001467 [Maribacter sp.]
MHWVVSGVSFIVGFSIGGSGDVYKEKNLLQFNYKNQPVSISVKGGDRETIEKIAKRINKKLHQALILPKPKKAFLLWKAFHWLRPIKTDLHNLLQTLFGTQHNRAKIIKVFNIHQLGVFFSYPIKCFFYPFNHIPKKPIQ